MNAKLSLAVLAATLAAAPAAMAQTYQNNAPQVPYERSSPSGLPTTSPQVESLQPGDMIMEIVPTVTEEPADAAAQ